MEVRESVLSARTAMIVQASIGISLLSTFLATQFYALREKWARLKFYRRTDRTIIYLMGMTTCALSFFIVQMIMYAHYWVGSEAACNIAGQPFIPLLFVMSKQFMYFFLYLRANVVLDILHLT